MENSSVFGLRHQARCLTAIKKSTEKSQFLAGTVGAKENVVCLLEYDDDNAAASSFSFRHPDEVWDIASCPTDQDLFFTCHSSASGNPLEAKATLWKKPQDIMEGRADDLKELLTLEQSVKKIIWNPHCNEQVASMGQNKLCISSIHDTKTLLTLDVSNIFSNEMDSTSLQQVQNIVWNLHQPELITVGGSSLTGWDPRTGKSSFIKHDAHQATIRALDCNPNKPHHLVTGGDDSLVHLWDTRQLNQPVISIKENTHWIWSTAFNPLQDQLLLTSSSDALVHLHNVFSVSSASNVEDDEDSYTSEKPKDGLICTFDQHEDSVYSVAWSPADAWTFASVSYSGRVVISQVPLDEKFKILGL